MSETPIIPLLINGQKVQSKSNKYLDVLNPADQSVVAKVPLCGIDEVDEAIANAKEAYKTWRNSGLNRRMRVMLKLQELVRDNTDKLAALITKEHGKTLPDAVREVGRGLEAIEHACSVASMQMGEFSENAASGVDVYTLIQPLGVVAGITAFNFPSPSLIGVQ